MNAAHIFQTGQLPTDLKNPTPDWTFFGTGAAIDVYNGIAALVLIAAGIAVLIGALLIAFGKLGNHDTAFTKGLVTVICGAAVGLIVGSASLIVNFGANFDLDKDAASAVVVVGSDPAGDLFA